MTGTLSACHPYERFAVRACAALLAILLTVLPAAAQEVCAVPWRLEETLTLGEIDGPLAFNDIRALDLDEEGHIYVAQGMSAQVSFFSPDGRLAGTIGRAGQGPGEFGLGVFDLGWRRDTLWVNDATSLHYFGPDGSFISRVPFVQGMARGQPLVDGSIVEWTTGLSLDRDITAYLRRSADGEVLDTIFREPNRTRTLVISLGGSRGFTAGVLQNYLRPRVTSDGSGILWIGDIRTERPSSFQLLKIDPTGDTLLRRQVAFEPRPISRVEADRLRQEVVDRLEGRYPLGQLERAVEEGMPIPDHYPPVREIVPGHDGTIWLLREPRADSVDVWEVYDSVGRLEGRVHVTGGRPLTVRLSPRMRLLRVTRDEVWAMTKGQFDEQYLHRFAVVNPCRRSSATAPRRGTSTGAAR